MGFQVVCGLKINLSKSEFVGLGEADDKSYLVEALGCKKSNIPRKYLGLPLGAIYKDRRTWDPIFNRIERRLAGWKINLLS